MPIYKPVDKCPQGSDWWCNDYHGRILKCPGCGNGMTVHVRSSGGICLRCNKPLKILTSDTDVLHRKSDLGALLPA